MGDSGEKRHGETPRPLFRSAGRRGRAERNEKHTERGRKGVSERWREVGGERNIGEKWKGRREGRSKGMRREVETAETGKRERERETPCVCKQRSVRTT